MLKRRDNFGSDAVALPQRNIFAPPAATPAREGAAAGGVFDAAAVCRGERFTENAAHGRAVAAAPRASWVVGRSRAAVLVRAFGGVAASASVAVALFGLPADRAAPRPVPAERHAEPAPAPAQRARPHPARGLNAPQARPLRSGRAMDREARHPRRPVRRRTAPTAPPVQPPVLPVAPRPAAPQGPEPMRVPADSPPEFL